MASLLRLVRKVVNDVKSKPGATMQGINPTEKVGWGRKKVKRGEQHRFGVQR